METIRKQHALPGDDTSTAEAASDRVGRGEQGDTRRANSTLYGGPHHELARLWLKTWFKNDFSIVHTRIHSSPFMRVYVF